MRNIAGLCHLDLPPLLQVQLLTSAMRGQLDGLADATGQYLRKLHQLENTVFTKEFEDLWTSAITKYHS